MTLIYVAYGGWDYEGNDSPIFAGTSYSLARSVLMAKHEDWPYHSLFIQTFDNGRLLKTESIDLSATQTPEGK